MDLLIFARWIFATAMQLSAGSHDWPLMAVETAAPAGIIELHTADPGW